jgi:hypothetical protein
MKPFSVIVQLKGLGHVPSFKNKKMLSRGRLITNPAKQRWMEKAINSIALQLRSSLATYKIETRTGQSPQSLTVSMLPLDDSLDWIGVPCGNWQRVKKGEEGAIVKIEKL